MKGASKKPASASQKPGAGRAPKAKAIGGETGGNPLEVKVCS